MGPIPLGGSEETHAIFDGNITEHLADLSAEEQRDVFKKLHDVVTSSAPPDSKIYEKIGNIDILKFSEKGRIYTKIVTNIPEGNTHYHVIYVLYIDNAHDYDETNLTKYDRMAENKLNRITSLSHLKNVEQYLNNHDSIDEEQLSEWVDRSID